MQKLLIPDYPILFLPKLAMKLGVSKALFLQQLHYWLLTSKHTIDGKKWVFNTYEEWQAQLPFLSLRQIKRIVQELQEEGYVEIGRFNQNSYDRTNWYTIRYDTIHRDKMSLGEGQNVTIEGEVMARTIPEITSYPSVESKLSLDDEIIQKIQEKCSSFDKKGYYEPTEKTLLLLKKDERQSLDSHLQEHVFHLLESLLCKTKKQREKEGFSIKSQPSSLAKVIIGYLNTYERLPEEEEIQKMDNLLQGSYTPSDFRTMYTLTQQENISPKIGTNEMLDYLTKAQNVNALNQKIYQNKKFEEQKKKVSVPSNPSDFGDFDPLKFGFAWEENK